LRPILVDVPTRVFLLGMIDKVVGIALERPIAAGGVGIEPTPRLHCQVGSLLHRLHREIFGRVDDDRALATDPGDDGRPVFVIVPPTRLTFLATPTRAASQRLLAALGRLALLPSGVIEVIRFDGALQLAPYLIRQGGIAQPPAPAIAGPDMDPQLFGNPTRGTRQAQQKRRKNPVHERALTAVQERACEVIEGALAGLLFTAVAFQTGLVVVRAPGTDVVAPTAGTLEWAIFPPQRMDIRLTTFQRI